MLTIIQEEDNSVSYRTYGSRTVQNTGDQQSQQIPVSSEYQRAQVPTPDLGSIMSVTNIPRPSHPIS